MLKLIYVYVQALPIFFYSRNLASGLLNRSTKSGKDVEPTKTLENLTLEDGDDSVYVNSYSNYSIHLEMLQVRLLK